MLRETDPQYSKRWIPFVARMLYLYENGITEPPTLRDYQRYRSSLADFPQGKLYLGGPVNAPGVVYGNKRRGHIVLTLSHRILIERRPGHDITRMTPASLLYMECGADG